MSHQALAEVIGVDKDLCKNCHACIAACPVKYCNDGSGESITINQDMCIGCGSCLSACTHGARHLIDDFPAFMADVRAGTRMVAAGGARRRGKLCREPSPPERMAEEPGGGGILRRELRRGADRPLVPRARQEKRPAAGDRPAVPGQSSPTSRSTSRTSSPTLPPPTARCSTPSRW